MGIVVVVLILKEFAALFACAGKSAAREPPGHWKEHLADFLLLAFGCVAYTAWWESLLDISLIEEALAGAPLALKLAAIALLWRWRHSLEIDK